MEEYVSCFRDGENVYYLNAKGRQLVWCNKVRKKNTNVLHYIMRNYIYIAFGAPETWRNEIRIKNGTNKHDMITVIADALFKTDGRYHVVEVDNEQHMKKNAAKMEKYSRLIERGAFGANPPVFVWITKTEYRREAIKKLCEGLEHHIFTSADFNA